MSAKGLADNYQGALRRLLCRLGFHRDVTVSWSGCFECRCGACGREWVDG